ncbi:hypothetical protein DKM19_03780 [Streptosporangium sp. 'caverna']|nr:hypothetical protein DKM19_03780 [Streptosporangium sp. 'caverna']
MSPGSPGRAIVSSGSDQTGSPVAAGQWVSGQTCIPAAAAVKAGGGCHGGAPGTIGAVGSGGLFIGTVPEDSSPADAPGHGGPEGSAGAEGPDHPGETGSREGGEGGAHVGGLDSVRGEPGHVAPEGSCVPGEPDQAAPGGLWGAGEPGRCPGCGEPGCGEPDQGAEGSGSASQS